uniref:Uncharacterized protein n=1 Tax=Tetranychus urticae TaxID=32264 RepID=T1KHW6_TETUR
MRSKDIAVYFLTYPFENLVYYIIKPFQKSILKQSFFRFILPLAEKIAEFVKGGKGISNLSKKYKNCRTGRSLTISK